MGFKLEAVAVVALVGLIGYGIYEWKKKTGAVATYLKTAPDYSQQQNLSNFGQYDAYASTLSPGSTMVTVGDTTYKIPEGETLNNAQRFLISLDKVIPGTWLTKAVLE